MSIDIPADLSKRLGEIAKREEIEVDELLRDLLARFEDNCVAKPKRRATTTDFARNALAAGLSSPHPVDTAERSREILNTEFADYLKRRAKQ